MLFVLEFTFLQALSVFGHGESVYHILDVTVEEALQIMGGITDAMVGHAALGEVVGTYLGTTVTGRYQRLATVGDIVYILLVLLVIDKRTQTRQRTLLAVSYTHLTLPTNREV